MYLELKQLRKEFESIPAVDNLNINIEKGELISLLGPSGCGKTTTLKMIGGSLKPTKGSIILDGIDISKLPPEKRPVSTVFQSYALFPHMSVIENVIYGLKNIKGFNKKEAIEKGEEILHMVGLNKYSNRNVTKLSGGQQQRVALARSLILNPKVLLLDEPLSNLDAKLRIKMRKDIKDIQKKFNITMLFVTHDQEEAMSISDRIVIMNSGKVEQLGKPEFIYRKPVNKFVAEFIGRANMIEQDKSMDVIRPEHVEFSRNSGDLKGKIIQKHFRGSFSTYFIETEKGIIQSDIINYESQQWNVNEEIYLKFIQKHTII